MSNRPKKFRAITTKKFKWQWRNHKRYTLFNDNLPPVDDIITAMNNGEYILPPIYARPYVFKSNNLKLNLWNMNYYPQITSLIKQIAERVEPVIMVWINAESPFDYGVAIQLTKEEYHYLEKRMTDVIEYASPTEKMINIKLLELANGYNSHYQFTRNGVL